MGELVLDAVLELIRAAPGELGGSQRSSPGRLAELSARGPSCTRGNRRRSNKTLSHTR